MASGFLCWICSICNNMFKNSRTLRLGGTAPRQVDSAQTKKRPQFQRTGGVMLRYKGLPECLSICELCVYCSSCTCTLSHLRELQGMWQTAGSQNLIPAVLDCSLWGVALRGEFWNNGIIRLKLGEIAKISSSLTVPLFFLPVVLRTAFAWCFLSKSIYHSKALLPTGTTFAIKCLIRLRWLCSSPTGKASTRAKL